MFPAVFFYRKSAGLLILDDGNPVLHADLGSSKLCIHEKPFCENCEKLAPTFSTQETDRMIIS